MPVILDLSSAIFAKTWVLVASLDYRGEERKSKREEKERRIGEREKGAAYCWCHRPLIFALGHHKLV